MAFEYVVPMSMVVRVPMAAEYIRIEFSLCPKENEMTPSERINAVQVLEQVIDNACGPLTKASYVLLKEADVALYALRNTSGCLHEGRRRGSQQCRYCNASPNWSKLGPEKTP